MSMPSPIQWIFPSNKFIDLQFFFFLSKKIKYSYKVCRMENKLKYFNFIDDRKKKLRTEFKYFLIHINHLTERQYQLSKTSYRAYITDDDDAYGSTFFLLVSTYINLHTILRMKHCKKYDWIMLKIYDVRFLYSCKYECVCV